MCARDLLYTTHDIRVHSSARVHSPSTLAALLRAPDGSTPAISQVLGVDHRQDTVSFVVLGAMSMHAAYSTDSLTQYNQPTGRSSLDRRVLAKA
jgi:hypothetical protein